MSKGQQSAKKLTRWGNSLLNRLSSLARNRRKRDASKLRRVCSRKQIRAEADQRD